MLSKAIQVAIVLAVLIGCSTKKDVEATSSIHERVVRERNDIFEIHGDSNTGTTTLCGDPESMLEMELIKESVNIKTYKYTCVRSLYSGAVTHRIGMFHETKTP